MAPRRREEIAKKIHETAVDISIVSLSPEEIDMRNIYAATMEAMYRAVRNLKIQPQAVIVDAMPLHFLCRPCRWSTGMPNRHLSRRRQSWERFTGII